jgi:hypothetical protein
MRVPLGVLFLEIEGKRLLQGTQGGTQAAMKPNTCNKTGDLDIFSIRLSGVSIDILGRLG